MLPLNQKSPTIKTAPSNTSSNTSFNPENITKDTCGRIINAIRSKGFQGDSEERKEAGRKAALDYGWVSPFTNINALNADKAQFADALYDSLKQQNILDCKELRKAYQDDKKGEFNIGEHTFSWRIEIGTGDWSGSDGVGLHIQNGDANYAMKF